MTRRACIGCGAQEEFYGCADIEIKPRAGGVQVVTPGNQPLPTAEETTYVLYMFIRSYISDQIK